MHHSPDTWHAATQLYFAAMLAANRADSTIRLHAHYLFQLQKRHRAPWRVTAEQLVAIMGTPTWGPEARKSARAVYRGFYRWAHGNGLIDHDPALALPPVPIPPPTPNPTPEIVVFELVHAHDERLAFMGMLAAFLGLRCMEIAVVHSDDWNPQTRRLRVHGKGGKVRELKVHSSVLAMLLDEVGGYAFPNRYTGQPLTRGHVSKLLSSAQPGTWTGHKLRHRAASVAYDATGNIFAVRDMLGHVSVDTTLIYTKQADRHVDEALEAASEVRLDRAS